MKKTFRIITAVVLAFVIATGSMSAFAANETVVLDLQDWKDEYFYVSQLTEGENNIELPGDELYYYHEFEAEKDGYYIVETNPEHIWWVVVAKENSSGVYKGEALLDSTGINYYDEETEKKLFRLEKGSYIFFTDRNEEFDGKTALGIEYAGAEITDFSFEGGVKYSLISQLNFIYFYHENEENNYFYFRPGNATLSFDSGKTYDVFIEFLHFESESEITEGENTITVEVAGKTFEKTVLVQGVEQVVKSVEVKNIDEFDTLKVYYDGCIETDDIDFTDLEFVVEFTNGEKVTVVSDFYYDNYYYAEVDLPYDNAGTVNISCDYYIDENDNVFFYVTVHDTEYAVFPVEIIEASSVENMKHLSEENTFVIAEETGDILWGYMNFVMSMGTDEVFDELMVLLESLFTFIPDIMKGMFGNFATFLGI